MKIQKYEKNQEFLPHYDYLEGIENQRIKTFIIYLNKLNKKDGGHTIFNYYKYKIQPKTGLAICFSNTDDKFNVNNLTMHQGEKIKTDKEKYILTIWIRKNKMY